MYKMVRDAYPYILSGVGLIVKIAIASSKNNMQFKVSEDINKKIKAWHTLIDEAAYDYQIRTGFISKWHKARIYNGLLDGMKWRAEKEGVKRPYAGAIGGGTSYKFSITDKGPMLRIYNYLTKRTLTVKNMPAADDNKKKQKLLIMFSMSGSEFKQFKEWKQTEKGHGDDCDYVYCFGPTSIGACIEVRNRKTKAVIDLTDYDSW
jgi:hypothetical protein